MKSASICGLARIFRWASLRSGSARYFLYWLMTGIHALHLPVGIAALTVIGGALSMAHIRMAITAWFVSQPLLAFRGYCLDLSVRGDLPARKEPLAMPRPPIRLVVTLVVLLGLMAGNIALAYIELGVFAPIAHVAIAVTMASIVLAVFMKLDRGASLVRVFAGAGFFWLAILLSLTWADYLTRYNFVST